MLLTLALALLAGLAGAFIALSIRQGAPPKGDALHLLLHDGLDLSEAQERRIEAEEKLYAARRAAHEGAVRDANAGLAAAIRTSQRDGPEVERAVDLVHRRLGAYQREAGCPVARQRTVRQRRPTGARRQPDA
ncbi:periplasmic heavy metal sensor [uncultured Sphingomonas sp.]|uniref:periplasmic heavy metal sensor n=1 Tax=uncultured Sphingomonas sp. TaxID=158754 RepID=UPI0035C9759D